MPGEVSSLFDITNSHSHTVLVFTTDLTWWGLGFSAGQGCQERSHLWRYAWGAVNYTQSKSTIKFVPLHLADMSGCVELGCRVKLLIVCLSSVVKFPYFLFFPVIIHKVHIQKNIPTLWQQFFPPRSHWAWGLMMDLASLWTSQYFFLSLSFPAFFD